MNRVTRVLPENPSLEQYKKQAKDLVKAHGAGDVAAAERIRAGLPRAEQLTVAAILSQRLTLSDAQLVLAREHGLPSWPKLKQRIETVRAERGDREAQVESFKSAIELGEPAELRRVLERFPDLKRRIDEPLFAFAKPAIVAAKPHRGMVEVLLAFGADINARSQWPHGSYGVLDDTTPEMAEFMLERGARLSIHAAAQLGKLEAVQAFIAADPSAVHARGPDGKLPLHVASTPQVVDCLLDHGAEIDTRDLDHAATAAQYAVKNEPVLRRLVERGCELDAFMAAALGDCALIDRTLGATPESLHAHAPCMIGETSAESGYYYPAPPEGSAHIYTWSVGFGWSVPYTAWRLGKQAACDYLLSKLPLGDQLAEACARLDARSVEQLAAKCPPAERVLSRKKVDLIAGRSLGLRHLGSGDTFGRVTGKEGVLASLALYLQAGFAADAPAYWGFTPLHWAAWLGHAGAVRLLLDGGANPEQQGGPMNATPLGAALHGCFDDHPDYGEYLEVFRLLLGAGAVVDPQWLPTEDAVVTRLLEGGLARS